MWTRVNSPGKAGWRQPWETWECMCALLCSCCSRALWVPGWHLSRLLPDSRPLGTRKPASLMTQGKSRVMHQSHVAEGRGHAWWHGQGSPHTQQGWKLVLDGMPECWRGAGPGVWAADKGPRGSPTGSSAYWVVCPSPLIRLGDTQSWWLTVPSPQGPVGWALLWSPRFLFSGCPSRAEELPP